MEVNEQILLHIEQGFRSSFELNEQIFRCDDNVLLNIEVMIGIRRGQDSIFVDQSKERELDLH